MIENVVSPTCKMRPGCQASALGMLPATCLPSSISSYSSTVMLLASACVFLCEGPRFAFLSAHAKLHLSLHVPVCEAPFMATYHAGGHKRKSAHIESSYKSQNACFRPCIPGTGAAFF